MPTDPNRPNRPGAFRPDPTLERLYPEAGAGGFSRMDGQIEFYTRINALVDAESEVLDFGAGRAQWAVDPMPPMSVRLRNLKGRVRRVVGADVDEAVRENPAVDEAVVLPPGGALPFEPESFDLVIADHVFEHVTAEDRAQVAADLMRVVRPGGWLAARTPNKWGYIGVGARAVPNRAHVRALTRLQPGRKAEDVFPVQYAMNTRRALRRTFPPPDHRLLVYGHTSEPAYMGSSVAAWRALALVNRLTPPWFAPTLMVFVQKVR